MLARLGLTNHPMRGKRNQISESESDLDDQWEVFRIGLITTGALLLFDIVVVAVMVYLEVSMSVFFAGTILVLILNLPVQVWIFSRMKRVRIQQIWEE